MAVVTLRDDLLKAAPRNQSAAEVAAEFARGLTRNDPGTFKAGYSRCNAILATLEVFPEVTAGEIRGANGWPVDAVPGWFPPVDESGDEVAS